MLPLAFVVAGCNPGGGGGGGGGGGTADWAEDGVTFNPTLAEQYRTSTEFNNVDADFVPPAPPNQSNPYELINLYLAHSATIGAIPLDGTGQLVAVVDDGILQSHREFDELGKLTIFGVVPTLEHGTHVASLIAGLRDGANVLNNMHGVAPGAALHFTSWNPTETDPALFAIANVTAGTLDAAALGAVAQNNSWGFERSATAWNSTSGSTASRLDAILGYGSLSWQSYLNALNTFQESGVIVWAMSNNDAYTNGSVMGTLPAFEPSLAEAWITAINGYFEVDGGGNITYAERLSAACGYAATFCLAADGTTVGADALANSSYSAGTGTSYSAPQIAGAIALLAQAFPDLTPEEWTKRLLASADSSWFASQNVDVDGTVDFGGGITRGYSNEWGLGVVDVAAALSPIGTVSVLAGQTVANANRTPLNNSHLVTAGAFGDALTLALDGHEMAVFDYFNGNFTMDAGQLVHAQPLAMVGNVLGDVGPMIGRPAGNSAMTLGAPMTMANGTPGGLHGSVGAYGISRASVLSMAVNPNVIGLGDGPISLYGFAGNHWAGAEHMMAGLGIDASVDALGGTLTFGVNQSFEQGALLGMIGNGAFDFGAGSSLSALHLGYSRALGDTLSVFGNFEIGIANALGFTGDGLVTNIGPVAFGGYSMGATLNDVFSEHDSLTFSVTGPTRVTAGEATVAMPVGRTAEGDILAKALAIDLAPAGRQRDFAFNYAFGVGDSGRISLGAQYIVDAGNIAGARGFGFALGYALDF